MPEVVQEYVNSSSLVRMREIQEQIIQAYIADFPKYNRRIDTTRISRVFAASALEVGKKVIYKRFDSESKSREVKRVIELLIDARVLLPTFHSDANTIPLEGEADLSVFKLYFLDVGLLNAILKLDIEAIDSNIKNNFNTKGVIAEQFVAQHLCFVNGHEKRPSLFYHLRDKGSQKAEIDFVIEKNGRILPIEVKATAVGHLKSLMQFMQSKDCEVGMKFSLSPFSEEFITLKNGQRKKLINVPLYAFLFYDYSKIK